MVLILESLDCQTYYDILDNVESFNSNHIFDGYDIFDGYHIILLRKTFGWLKNLEGYLLFCFPLAV